VTIRGCALTSTGMEPEARYTAIGAVLLVLVFALAAAAVWLTRSGARADVRHYTVYFERQSLQGLQVGSGVDMRGIQVGRVERFAFSRDNINRVQVTLRVVGKTPVSENTVAVVERKILTGLARISLETPGTPGPQLTAVPPGETYPVIAEGQSDFDQFSDSLNRLAITGTSALTGVNELLNEQNRKELMDTLAGLRTMSQAMAGAAQDLARSGRQIASAADKAGAAAQPTADQASATLRDVSRAAEAFEREFRATAQELRTSAEIVARTAERLDDPRALIFGPTQQQLGPGEKLR
jgi:phospholipid/cholesterol/gamma-HCH transport system substrate-binding protein